MEFGPDRWRLYRLAAREAGRAMRESAVWSLSRLSSAPAPTRLLFAPQDLRTADPTIATDIYSGFFAFSGRAITTGGRSPFAFTPPSRAWGEALYG
ncbi:MAG: heparinase, partial [Microvirga sp.]